MPECLHSGMTEPQWVALAPHPTERRDKINLRHTQKHKKTAPFEGEPFFGVWDVWFCIYKIDL